MVYYGTSRIYRRTDAPCRVEGEGILSHQYIAGASDSAYLFTGFPAQWGGTILSMLAVQRPLERCFMAQNPVHVDMQSVSNEIVLMRREDDRGYRVIFIPPHRVFTFGEEIPADFPQVEFADDDGEESAGSC
jgi:hypothetical protein